MSGGERKIGSYFPAEQHDMWQHVILSAALFVLAIVNIRWGSYVIRSENAFNLAKMTTSSPRKDQRPALS